MKRLWPLAVAFAAACGPIPAPGPVSISVDPVTATLVAGAQKDFTATVTGSKDHSVTWSVKEGGGGTVDTTGHYTAPPAAGTFHLVATANADSTKSAIALVTVTQAPPVQISISPATVELGFQATQQFTAVVTNSSNQNVTWSVLEGAPGGSVSPTGLYTSPLSEGTFHVVATADADGTQNAIATVTVHSSVAVTPATATLNPLQTQPFTATVAGGGAVSWSVAEGAVGGSIDDSGNYTASSAVGVYHVVATSLADSSVFGTAVVTVSLNPEIGVSLSPKTATLNQGAELQLTATVSNSSNTAVTFSVREGAPGGSVSATGHYVAPPVPGTYHVVATSVADPTKSALATLTVIPVSVTLSPMMVTVPSGGSQAFTATVLGTSDPSLNWMASAGTVDASGHFTAAAHGPGTVNVTATSIADSTKSATATVTVTPVQVAITSAPGGSVDQGSSFTFAALVTGGADNSFTWSATCGTFAGAVWTAPSTGGSCTITATSVLDPSAHDSVTVTVRDVAISITAQPSSAVDQGSSFTFAAVVTGSVDTAVSWSASCGSFAGATWTAPNAAGSCTITATAHADGSKTAQATVSVNAVAIQITTAPSGSVDQGSSFTFAATVTGSVNTAATFSAPCGSFAGAVWTAPNAAGPCTITATASADSSKTAQVSVTVKAVVVTITSAPSSSVNQGSTFTFAASVVGSVDTGVTWSASCGSFAGAVWTAPNSAGSCIITATSHGDPTSKTTVTVVVKAVVVSITSAPSSSVNQGSTFAFAASVVGSVDTGVVWSASCGSFAGATWTAPAAAGPCVITATSHGDPSSKTTATVTVNTVVVTLTTTTAGPLDGGAQFTFAASVTGTVNPAVTWSASCGTMNGSTFTAPNAGASCTVTATSVWDSSKKAQQAVAINAVKVTVAPSQTTVAFGDSQPFSATVSGDINPAVTWSIAADPGTEGAVDSSGVYSTATATAARPFTLTLRATSAADGTTFGSATVTVVDSTLHTVSGTVSYVGARGPGRVYVAFTDPSGAVVGGTSMASPGAFTVRCLGGVGTYTVRSWMDLDGFARPDFASFPAGTSTFSFSGTDVTGANVTLSDPSPAVPGTTGVTMLAFDRGMTVHFARLLDSNGLDLADHYDVFLSTTPNPGPANNVFSRTVSATSTLAVVATGLTNGTGYYAGVRAVSTAGAGAIATTGPVSAGAQPGGFTVSGRVLLPAASSSPLVIGLQSSGGFWATTVTNPGTSNPFTLDVPAGSYTLLALLDLGADGVFTPLDTTVEEELAVSGNLTAPDLVVPSTGASFTVTTDHDFDVLSGPLTERWYLGFALAPVSRIPVRAQLISGVQAADLPLSLGVEYTSGGPTIEGRSFYSVSASPVAGDSYSALVWYADGSSEVLTSTVNAVLTPPSSLAPSGSGAGLTPTLSWAAPVPAPAGVYTYDVFVDALPGINPLFTVNHLPSATLSIPYAGPALTGGQNYGLYVRVRDALDNSATADVSFSP